MSSRMIDRNGHRFGAAVSALGLIGAFLADWAPISYVMTGVFAIGVIFGLRYSPMGATYRTLKRIFNLKIPVIPEEEAPPRFAQTMGLAFCGAAAFAHYLGGWSEVAWALILIVAALQSLLGITGICVGCEVYVVGRRIAARSA